MRRRLVLLCVLWLVPQLTFGAFPVIDVSAIAQLVQQLKMQLEMYRQMIEQTRHQVTQIYNQYEQIKHAYETVKHGVQNLLTLDLQVSQLTDLMALGQQLDQKLAYAEYLGYRSGQTWEQAKGLYPQIRSTMTGKQYADLRRRWAEAERQTAHVALETQAIAEEQRRYRQGWQHILAASEQAKGNLQIQQIQAQMLALQGSQLQQIQQHLATEARHTTEKALQEASQTELELAAHEAATKAYNLQGFTPAGKLLSMPRTGKE